MRGQAQRQGSLLQQGPAATAAARTAAGMPLPDACVDLAALRLLKRAVAS